MRILLIDFDSKIPNLALMKLSAYFKAYYKGLCDVGFDTQDPDRVYVSVVFSKNRPQAAGITTMYPHAKVEFGGPGWDLKSHLPPDIEFIKPDYDIYPSKYSQGFTTRGCIRKCPPCIVPEKEGRIQAWQHPSEFHDERFNTCMIMDNNLFAAPQSWQDEVFSWFIDNEVEMRSHGWDARLLTKERAETLKAIKHKGNVSFAFDNVKDEPAVIKAIDLLKNADFDLKREVSFYVFTGGFGSGFEDALYRCNRLREMGTNAFVMRYHNKDPNINRLAKWANRRWAYWSSPFEVTA